MKFSDKQVIADRYQIESFHLQGGMQEVYRCHDLTLDRIVALKTPREGIVDKRFNRGAQMGAKVIHPNVAATLDYVDDGSSRCLIEEFVEGLDLGRRLADQFFYFDPFLASWTAHNIAKGLLAAHQVGICHRDLKPSNIMTSADVYLQNIKLTDFGIAKLAEKEIEVEIEKFEQDENTLLSSNTLLGAVPYLAPECWSDWSNSGQPADIWAFGAILAHMLLGKMPFGGGKNAIMKMAVAQVKKTIDIEKPNWFDRHAETGDLEQELWQIVLACLTVEPSARPTAADLVKRCDALCYNASIRRYGTISTYPHVYPSGSKAKAGFIKTDAGDSVFFHSTEYFGETTIPKVGERVIFGSAPGHPRPRCSPVLVMKLPP